MPENKQTKEKKHKSITLKTSSQERFFPNKKHYAQDKAYMDRALDLSEAVLGKVAPNPAVGCVIVKQGQILGEAVTANGGRPHAETQALEQAGKQAKGASVYVTLEPCTHFGQTPPCVEALIRAEVKRIVIACQDPDPRVNGEGIRALQATGIEVVLGIGRRRAEWIHAGFFSRIQRGRPLLVVDIQKGGYDFDFSDLEISCEKSLKEQLSILSESGITRIRIAPDHVLLSTLKAQSLIDYDLTLPVRENP